MARLIINIDQIVAGRGLRSDCCEYPPRVEVFCGSGMTFGDENDLTIDAGAGLGFNEDDQLTVLNEELAGDGLVPGDGSQLNLDTAEDSSRQQTFQVVTDAKFQMQDCQPSFCTTYTTFIVRRNIVGFVIGIEQGESVTECIPLCYDGYSCYGYCGGEVMGPQNAVSRPVFYKK